MRVLNTVLLMMPILIVLSASSSVTVSVPFSAQTASPLAQSGQIPSPNQLSTANSVYVYNNQNGLWLLTCPNAPEGGNGQSTNLFQSTPFGNGWDIAGNLCGSAGFPVPSQPVTLTLTDTLQPASGLPDSSTSQVNLIIQNAVYAQLNNIGYSPEVASPNGDAVSTAFNTKSYIFDSVPVRGQQGLWTWSAFYPDLANLGSMENGFSVTAAPEQGSYSQNSCQWTYQINSVATLTGIQPSTIPFLTPQGAEVNIGILPYFIYTANVINDAPLNQFNTQLSYDIFSPMNYYNPQGVIEPFTINSLGFFFGNYSGKLSYFTNTGSGFNLNLGVDFSSNDPNIGTLVPIQSSSSSSTGGTGGTGPVGPQQIWAALTGAGFSAVQAAGIMGNAAQETGGQSYQNINVEENIGGACFGMVCFTTGGGYVASQLVTGNPSADLTAQVAMIASQCGPTNTGCWGGASDPASAALAFSTNWERCGACNNPVREAQAQAVYSAAQSGNWPMGSGTPSPSGPTSTGYSISIAPMSISGLSNGDIFVMANSLTVSSSGGSSGGYFYPLGPGCSMSRTDMGQDWAGGPCPIYAIGSGTIVAAPFANQPSQGHNNWYGNFYVLKLDSQPTPSDPLSSQYVYYAEGVSITVPVGTHVNAGQQIGTVQNDPDGVEFGWACPTQYQQAHTLAACNGYGGTDNTPYGEDFFNFINCNTKVPSSYSSTSTTYTATCTGGASPAAPSGPTSTSGSSFSSPNPQAQGYVTAVTAPSINIYILKSIPEGYYNTSLLPPNSVPASPSSGASGNPSPGGSIGSCVTPTGSWQPLGSPTLEQCTAGQIESAWVAGGGPAAMAPLMAGIALAESGGYINVQGDGGCGWWGFTPCEWASPSQAGPVVQGQAAVQKYQGELGASTPLSPWFDDRIWLKWQAAGYPGWNGNGQYPDAATVSGWIASLDLASPSEYADITDNPVPSGSPSAATSPTDTFSSNWQNYWNQVNNLQSNSVYAINALSVSGLLSNTILAGNFMPMNMSVDVGGDAYIVGLGQNGQSGTWLVHVSNTINGNPISVQIASICPLGAKQTGGPICAIQWNEIAASPTGSEIFLANPAAGDIEVFGSNLGYIGQITLDYQSDGILESGLGGTGTGNPVTYPSTNIIDYLQNGGLYGVNANCKSSCSAADNVMHQIFQQYQSVLNEYNQYTVPTQDTLDKARLPGANPNSNYHHPLGIEDINGYLYVLDEWDGVAGEICADPIDVLGIFKGCGGSVGGVLFNIVTLRIINSSGVDVPYAPTYYNDQWQYNSAKTQLSRFPYNSPIYYPPYGWVISASVVAMNDKGTGLLCSGIFGCGNGPTGPQLNLCSESDCTNYGSANEGSLAPVGPMLNGWGNPNADLPGAGYHAVWLLGTGFSVNFNNTLSLYIPSSDKIKTTSDANTDGELLIARVNPANYTKSIGGKSYPQINYLCYNTAPSALCSQKTSELNNMWWPVYSMENPFEFDENIGNFQTLVFDSILSSGFAAGQGIGQKVGVGSTLSSFSQGVLNNNVNQYISSPPNLNNLQMQNAVGFQTTLNSIISGYVILPYSYTISINQYISNIQASSSSCGVPIQLSQLESPPPTVYTGYAYTQSPTASSNFNTAQVEGGASYARSGLNATYYYEANLSSIIAPQTLLYNILTNRLLGKIYINSTISPATNDQQIINATNQYAYGTNVYSQGANPGYEQVSATPTPNSYNPQLAAPLANINKIYGVNNNMSAPLGAPVLVTLFNWFKLPTQNIDLMMQLTGAKPGSSESAYGYHRIVYVFNDRFNNTIYMPLDVDISNITQINLNVTPSVNPNNVNMTTVYINGTVTWTPPFTTKTVPLSGGYIYLYYDTNLNTVGFDAASDPTDAATCAFSSTNPPSPSISQDQCRLANPVWLGLQGPNLDSANIVTYQPNYDVQGTCPQPSGSLLTPINQIYTLCNIYPAQASKFNLPTYCPTTGQGATQYCTPVFENGTGICTAQVGLIGEYPTNSNGYFSANIVACGAGSPRIIAQYYGTPTPEPITASQSPLSVAADPSSSQHVNFMTANYAWSPVQVSETTQIGSLLLSFGSIAYLPVFIVASAAIVLLYGAIHRKPNPPHVGRISKKRIYVK